MPRTATPTTPPPSMAPPPANEKAAPNPTKGATIVPLDAKFPPPRIVLNAVEGFGKTSAGAYAPNPVLLMAEGESGALTLMGSNLIPQVPGATISSWPELMATIDALCAGTDAYGTLVLDAISGFEKLCHTHVCSRDFAGEWGEKGFLSYHKGYEVATNDWLLMLAALDRLRATKGTTIFMLSHSQVRPHRNPVGEDFDRYVADCHPKTWAPTAKWADCVLFGNFLAVIDKGRTGKERAKGMGGTERVIYTTRRDAWDAKNRYNMPEFLQLDTNPANNWDTIWNAIIGKGTTHGTT